MSVFVSRYPDLLRRAVGHLLYPSITRQSVRASHILYRSFLSLASFLSRHIVDVIHGFIEKIIHIDSYLYVSVVTQERNEITKGGKDSESARKDLR